jgi:hypothetical protein
MGHLSNLITDFSLHHFVIGLLPVGLWRLVADGMEGNLETFVVELVHQLVVCIFVADVECGTDFTPVTVGPAIQKAIVGYDVKSVNSIVEG